jgi:ubiquinone/menaquinone biosynthesis C-methylase UbiE
MDIATKTKWDNAAKLFDFMNGYGPERRWGPAKKELYANMSGKVLFLALGTGLDIQCFPAGQDITGIDISSKMLEYAKPRIESYQGSIEAHEMDVTELQFADDSFDQVFTSCTFCSVQDPIAGLKELYRVLKPGGQLYMFEHTGSRHFPFNFMLNVMSPLTRSLGPDMSRKTEHNVTEAGFQINKVTNIYLDVVKTICAEKPTQ